MAGAVAGVLSSWACLDAATAQPLPTEAGRPLDPVPIDPPARPGSGFPSLASEDVTTLRRGHDVLMTWLEPGEPLPRLRFARLAGDAWTTPVTVAGPLPSPGPLDPPSLTVLDTQGVRRTLIARAGEVVARSGDAGRTWSRLPAPPLPFASFAGGDEGGYAFWLGGGGEGPAQLLGSRVLTGEEVLDPRVAGRSPTAAAMTWDGPVVAYRDAGDGEGHGIVVVRREDARWTEPGPVHADDAWRPGEGPAGGLRMAARERRVAVAWYTEAPELPRVLVAFSEDAGRTFGSPVEVDAQEDGGRAPSGRVDVALDDAGNAVVLWTARDGTGEATLRLARVSPGAGPGEPLELARGISAAPEGTPQMARAGERVAVAWVDGMPGRLRAVAVPLATIPAPEARRAARGAARGPVPRRYTGQGRVGEPLPDADLLTLDGEPVSLASLRGRPVLLNLWATWCMPCIAEMPELAELQERYGPEGLAVVGLSVDDAEAVERVRAFVSERKVRIPVWLDPEMEVYDALRIRGLPATFVVDREGRILARRAGAITADDPDLMEALRRAIAGGAAEP